MTVELSGARRYFWEDGLLNIVQEATMPSASTKVRHAEPPVRARGHIQTSKSL